MMDDDLMLDVQAAARFTGIAAATLAKMRCMGGGPLFVKLGRRVVYRRSDVIAWLNARRVRNTTEAAHSVPRRLTDS
jgi:predicted DNA-binding transcriptional regulator AlpA